MWGDCAAAVRLCSSDLIFIFFFSSRRRHTRLRRDWSSDVCSSDLTTSHPVEFSDRLIQTYAEVPELVSHVHLPVQSGSDKILGSMKRGHTVIEYKSKIRKLREIRPDISLSSDFIIGFPGETEEDFNNTMKLIDEMCFDKSFSFIYSKRPGTIAASLPDDVDLTVKKKRLAEIGRASCRERV